MATNYELAATPTYRQPENVTIVVIKKEHGQRFSYEQERILIQTNQSFTYQGETLAQLEGTPFQNGVLATWKFNVPKATNQQ